MNNRKDINRRTIRNAVGLPDDNAKIVGLVSEDPFEICENTITSKCQWRSANCEVNAENQGVVSEVPRPARKK